MATNLSSWSNVYKRINTARKSVGLSWNELADAAGIPVSSWMVGLNITHPSDDEIRAIAPVVNSTYEYLRYGTK